MIHARRFPLFGRVARRRLFREPIGTRDWPTRQQTIAVIRLVAKPANYIRISTAITECGDATDFKRAASSFYFLRRRRLPDEVGVEITTDQRREQIASFLLGSIASETVAGRIKRTRHVFPKSMRCIFTHG